MSERDSYVREAQEHYRIGKIYLEEATAEMNKGEDRDDRGISIVTDHAQAQFLAGLLCLGLGGGGEHPVPVYR
jgi:hypothetical protein